MVNPNALVMAVCATILSPPLEALIAVDLDNAGFISYVWSLPSYCQI